MSGFIGEMAAVILIVPTEPYSKGTVRPSLIGLKLKVLPLGRISKGRNTPYQKFVKKFYSPGQLVSCLPTSKSSHWNHKNQGTTLILVSDWLRAFPKMRLRQIFS
jgi:hypothetical protein